LVFIPYVEKMHGTKSLKHTNLFIKNPFLCYLHNHFIELLVYHTEIFEAFFPL